MDQRQKQGPRRNTPVGPPRRRPGPNAPPRHQPPAESGQAPPDTIRDRADEREDDITQERHDVTRRSR